MASNRKKVALAYLVIGAWLAPAYAQAPGQDLEPRGGLERLAFFLGEWELQTFDWTPGGGHREGRATSHAYLTLDGYAMIDDFRALNRSGRVVFRGTSIRTVDPETGDFLVRWVMVDDPGYTLIRARFEGPVLVGTGEGVDAGGKFVERFRYIPSGDDRYRFKMDRSYNGGATWIEDFNVIEARRAGAAPPDRSSEEGAR